MSRAETAKRLSLRQNAADSAKLIETQKKLAADMIEIPEQLAQVFLPLLEAQQKQNAETRATVTQLKTTISTSSKTLTQQIDQMAAMIDRLSLLVDRTKSETSSLSREVQQVKAELAEILLKTKPPRPPLLILSSLTLLAGLAPTLAVAWLAKAVGVL